MDRAEIIPRAARRALPLRLYFFASFAALGVYSPFFPRWLVARGIEGISMGAVAATMPAMGVLGPPLVGFLADSLGLRGSLLRLACLGSALAFAVLAVAGLAHHRLTLGEILALVLVFAVFRAPMLMMADVVAVEGERDGGASYGMTRLWGSVGFLVASIGGGRCLDPASPTALPGLVAASLFVALLTALLIPVRSTAARPFPEAAGAPLPGHRLRFPLAPLRRVRGRGGDLLPRALLLALPLRPRRASKATFIGLALGLRRLPRDPHDGRGLPAHRPLRRPAPPRPSRCAGAPPATRSSRA